jgi:valyl-tRNA synthetase
MLASTALVISTQVRWFNLYFTSYQLYFNYVTMFLKNFYQLSEIERSLRLVNFQVLCKTPIPDSVVTKTNGRTGRQEV